MNKILIVIFGVLFITIGCKNNIEKVGQKKISMTDASSVITETDSEYLGNIVEDITKKNNTTSKQEVTSIIAKVDSVKEASAIANTESNDVNGTNIECKDFKVTFSIIMNQSGDHYTATDLAKLNDAQIQVNGLVEPKIEQRFFTKLKIDIKQEKFILEELLENANPWQNLASNNNIFTSANYTTLSFRDVDKKSILLATDRAMRKAGKVNKELEEMKKTIAPINKYSDAPCEVFATTIHYKISGKKNGKKVSETIKISL